MEAYKKVKKQRGNINGIGRSTEQLEGESIEDKIKRIVNNKEPIKDGAPLIYTDRKDGVKEAYNIRTDRFEVAINAMDKVNKAKIAKRDAPGETKKDDKVKPIHGETGTENASTGAA